MDCEILVPRAARRHEAAKLRGRGVVRVAFELGAEREELRPFERPIAQGVERVEHAEAHRHAAPEPARARDLPSTVQVNGNGAHPDLLEKLARRGARHRHRVGFRGFGHGDVVVNLQRDAQTVEAGAEIRSGGGHAHRDLLLFQRKSAEMPLRRAMTDLNLTRTPHASKTTARA